jgi:hypothetical protein
MANPIFLLPLSDFIFKGEAVRKTELLPDGWNSCQDVYVLRYESEDGVKYVFKVVKIDSALLVHFLVSDLHVVIIIVKPIGSHEL